MHYYLDELRKLRNNRCLPVWVVNSSTLKLCEVRPKNSSVNVSSVNTKSVNFLFRKNLMVLSMEEFFKFNVYKVSQFFTSIVIKRLKC